MIHSDLRGLIAFAEIGNDVLFGPHHPPEVLKESGDRDSVIAHWEEEDLLTLLENDEIGYTDLVHLHHWFESEKGKFKMGEMIKKIMKYPNDENRLDDILMRGTSNQWVVFAHVLIGGARFQGSMCFLRYVEKPMVQEWMMRMLELRSAWLTPLVLKIFPWVLLAKRIINKREFRNTLAVTMDCLEDGWLNFYGDEKHEKLGWVLTANFAKCCVSEDMDEMIMREHVVAIMKESASWKFLHSCFACGKRNEPMKVCRGCEVTYFCSKRCQKAGWKEHASFGRAVEKV